MNGRTGRRDDAIMQEQNNAKMGVEGAVMEVVEITQNFPLCLTRLIKITSPHSGWKHLHLFFLHFTTSNQTLICPPSTMNCSFPSITAIPWKNWKEDTNMDI